MSEKKESVFRIKIMFWVMAGVFILLAARLFFIQIVGIEAVQETYSGQHSSRLIGMNHRGDILDRNGALLVNREEVYVILVDKTKYGPEAESYLEMLDAERISLENRRYYGFQTEEYDGRIMKAICEDFGGFVFLGTERYSNPQPAAHLIGYCNLSENLGTFGLERQFDDLLGSDGQLSLTVDGAGRVLPGYGLSYNVRKEGAALRVTLDCGIQQMAEEILQEEASQGGAVVIADAKTGGILCGASTPGFDPCRLQDAEGSALMNKVLQAPYSPGSVFKIIVAAAAVEEGIAEPETMFYCSGGENLYGVRMSCNKEEGHGEISFAQGFARSCNCVFIQLGRELGSEKILNMAKRFGLGERVLDCLEEESGGSLPDEAHTAGAGIGNLSIGQGETQITCLQAAQIAGIVACRGKNPGLYLVEGQENPKQGEQVISVKTALVLRKLMIGVVEEGTGRRAGSDSAGKSGSVQSYQNGKKVVHGWYTGFFPVRNPEYIVAVFTEASGGASAATRIFGEIHGRLTEKLPQTARDDSVGR